MTQREYEELIAMLKSKIKKQEIKIYNLKKDLELSDGKYNDLKKRYNNQNGELVLYKAKFGSLIDTKEPSKHK